MSIISLFSALMLSVAHATDGLNLEQSIEQVWTSSPQLVNQKIQYDLAERDRWRRFVFNEPSLQYSNSDNNTAQSWGLQLPLGFPGKAFALKNVDEAKAQQQKAELGAKKYDLARSTAQSYLDCASSQETANLQQTYVNDLQTVARSLRSSYESGHSTQAEKIGSELLARQASADLQTSLDKAKTSCRKLLRLLSVDSSTSADVVTNLKVPDDVDLRVMNELDAETSDQARSRATMAVSQATKENSLWSQLPDFNLSVMRNHYLYLPGSPSGQEWTTTYGVGVTIPLFFPFYESAEYSRTKSQALIDQNVAELQKISADADKDDAVQEYKRSKKRLSELRHTDLVLAEALVESTYSAYRSGKLGYAELVLARKTWADLKNQDIQLRVSVVTAHLRCLNQCD